MMRRHHDADQLRRDELHTYQATAGWIVNAGADFNRNDLLQERSEQAHLRTCQ